MNLLRTNHRTSSHSASLTVLSLCPSGRYCMVVGEILSGSPPEISVIKLAPLPDIHRQMWELEVRHVRRYLEETAAS